MPFPIPIRYLILSIGMGSYFSAFSQTKTEEKLLKGKVTHPTLEVSNIHIINSTTKKYTITDGEGNFHVNASIKDTIKLKSIHFEEKAIVVTPIIYNTTTLLIELTEKINTLNEVVISKHGLTGNLEQDLALIPTKKKRTNTELGLPEGVENPQEKIVSLAATFNYGLITSIQLEPLQKHLNGYYKNLKKKRKWTAQNKLADDVLFFYKKELFINTFKIPEDQIVPFIYFCIEDHKTLESDFRNNHHEQVLAIFEKQCNLFIKE